MGRDAGMSPAEVVAGGHVELGASDDTTGYAGALRVEVWSVWGFYGRRTSVSSAAGRLGPSGRWRLDNTLDDHLLPAGSRMEGVRRDHNAVGVCREPMAGANV